MPHFSEHYRHRFSDFDILAIGFGQVAPHRKTIVPVAKIIGKEILVHASHEMIEIATPKKTPKQALKHWKAWSKNKLEGDSASFAWKEKGTGKKQATKTKKCSFQATNSNEKSLHLFHPRVKFKLKQTGATPNFWEEKPLYLLLSKRH